MWRVWMMVGLVACGTPEAPEVGDTGVDADSDAGLDDTDPVGGRCEPGDEVERLPGSEVALDFLALDNGTNRLLRVDELGSDSWSVALPGGGRDLTVVGDEVLVSVGNGALRLDVRSGAEVWSVDGYVGVQSAQPLADGRVLLGRQVGSSAFLTEIDSSGAAVSEVEIPATIELRLVRRQPDGHTLLTTAPPWKVVEVDAEGTVVWSGELPGKGYLAQRWCDERTVATTGGDARVVALDLEGSIVSSWGGKSDHPDLGLDWFSGFQLIPGGTVVVANWLGHVDADAGPHVVALSADDEVLWTWHDDGVRQVTNVVVLAASGLP